MCGLSHNRAVAEQKCRPSGHHLRERLAAEALASGPEADDHIAERAQAIVGDEAAQEMLKEKIAQFNAETAEFQGPSSWIRDLFCWLALEL